jgi:hypothetical protein
MATRRTPPQIIPSTQAPPAPYPFDHHRVVVGYHGCDKEVGEAVLLGQQPLMWSRNPYDWLGHGIYFWEHGPQRAVDWAQEVARRDRTRGAPRVRDPFILGAYIYLGRCLDLTDIQDTQRLEPVYRSMEQDYRRQDKPMPSNKAAFRGDGDFLLRDLDCALLNFLNDQTDAVLAPPEQRFYHQTVRGAFHEGQPAFPGSGLKLKTHIQIAVRDSTCIMGYFKPNRGAP